MASIRVLRGTEGPQHDPYGYTRVVLRRTDGVVVTYHQGLGEWCRVVTPRSADSWAGCESLAETASGEEAERLFTARTGLSPWEAEKIAERSRNRRRCSACGSRRGEWRCGMPGERLRVCSGCGGVTAAESVLSEVE